MNKLHKKGQGSLRRSFSTDGFSRILYGGMVSQPPFHFGKGHRILFVPLGNHCQIVKIFKEAVIFPYWQDNGFFPARGTGDIFGMRGLHGCLLKSDLK